MLPVFRSFKRRHSCRRLVFLATMWMKKMCILCVTGLKRGVIGLRDVDKKRVKKGTLFVDNVGSRGEMASFNG